MKKKEKKLISPLSCTFSDSCGKYMKFIAILSIFCDIYSYVFLSRSYVLKDTRFYTVCDVLLHEGA
jgi:hypothetical protein